MRFYVGVTDYDWWVLHFTQTRVEEVNFWKPSGNTRFAALKPGEPFLFKLHSPRNYIAGGGFFSKFLFLPISLAWEAFGLANGATSLAEIRHRIGRYRNTVPAGDDPQIGCILLEEPFFWEEDHWIPIPEDFHLNIVSGKSYSTEDAAGRRLWAHVAERLVMTRAKAIDPGPALIAATDSDRYGSPQLVQPRLGQGTFRILVTDAYGRRCAMSGEKTLPVLEAAHIRPYADGGSHEPSNGLLLRSDLHTLFDRGYIGIDPSDHRIMVSKRIKEQFENGRHYYALAGTLIASPLGVEAVPNQKHLHYHAENIFI
jgi:putative restriction endonuclease